jgi:hypothetical protein
VGRAWSLPPKLIDWSAEDVTASMAECQRKAEGPGNSRSTLAVAK